MNEDDSFNKDFWKVGGQDNKHEYYLVFDHFGSDILTKPRCRETFPGFVATVDSDEDESSQWHQKANLPFWGWLESSQSKEFGIGDPCIDVLGCGVKRYEVDAFES